ncbi:MAG TPA: hypothetical protein VGG35_09495 [Streptosporangiaceae bacterium]
MTGRKTTAAAANCTAVTATGSRPRSSAACRTVKAADISSDTRIRPSPLRVEPPPWPATRTTPATDSRYPAQAAGRAMERSPTAAMTATSTGVVPTSSAACVTLVRRMPAFCTKIVPP